MTAPTPFPDLNDVLSRLVEGAQAILGPDFIAAYLTGSFALDDADGGSDADFVIVTRTFLRQEQQDAVQTLQRALYDSSDHWGKHLEGSYFSADLLRHSDPARLPIPYFNHGSRDLEFSDHDNTLVVRWVTRKYGLPLSGPPPQQLIDPVDPDELRAAVRVTLHAWGEALLADPDSLNNDWRQALVVLLMTRMLHTIDTGEVYSKKAAIEWARDHLNSQWPPLLERAWSKHPDQFLRYHKPADPDDLALMRGFIEMALTVPH